MSSFEFFENLNPFQFLIPAHRKAGEPPSESVRRQPDSEDGESVEPRHFFLLSIISIMARFKRPALRRNQPPEGSAG